MELWNIYEAEAAPSVHGVVSELAFMEVCLNVNHSLANGKL